MSHLMKAATHVACTMIKAKAMNGATTIDTDAVSKDAVDLVMKIKNELVERHEGVCDPDALTPHKVDEIIGKHIQAVHSLMHKQSV